MQGTRITQCGAPQLYQKADSRVDFGANHGRPELSAVAEVPVLLLVMTVTGQTY